MRDRLGRRLWLPAVAAGLIGATAAVAYARPWHDAAPAADAVSVERTTLRPGSIELVVVNHSEQTAHVAQIILNDAFVDFRQSETALTPGAEDRITVSYPWIAGESYDVSLLTATGATIDYGIEEAEAGTQQA
jgi:ZIP family zinc transporter